jgi:membrane-bound serine protease (ClpP class)
MIPPTEIIVTCRERRLRLRLVGAFSESVELALAMVGESLPQRSAGSRGRVADFGRFMPSAYAAGFARIIAFMRAWLAALALLAPSVVVSLGGAWVGAQPAQDAPRTATLLEIDGAIGPATSDYIVRGIEAAPRKGHALVILQMDTPGGLDTSMRDIIRAILASPVPVVAYVYPPGARAASAGTYILYASHVAAMAPATNLGAATPISIGAPSSPGEAPDEGGRGDSPPGDADDEAKPEKPAGAPEPRTTEERKALNDAIAYIRSLAEQRGRNADWAEQAVREAASLSARSALEQRVIDLVADDLDDLLAKLDGREVSVAGEARTLATKGLVLERVEADWRTRLLEVISNPTVAYLLLLIGIYGLIFEGYSPGAVLPGVVGAISLLLALFAFQVLPVNYAGLALIALGVILMTAEFMVPSFGSLGIGGVASFVFGSVILIDTNAPGYGISIPLLVTMAVAGSLAMLGIIWMALRSRRLPVVSGVEDLAQATATALEDFEREGDVRVRGERWRARSASPVRKGDELRVVGVENLVLQVEPRERAD